MCKINKNPNEFALKANHMQIWMSKNIQKTTQFKKNLLELDSII